MEARNPFISHYTIEILNGPEKGVKFKIDSSLKQVLVGRSPECDVQIAKDAKLSRKHIVLQFEKSEVTLTNLSSKNEVYVNGEGVQQAVLHDGDQVRIGSTKLQFNLAYNQPMVGPSASVPQVSQDANPDNPYDFVAGASPQPGIPAIGDPFASPPPVTGGGPSYYTNHQPAPSSPNQKQGDAKFRFYIIVFAVAALFVWLLSSKQAPQAPPPDLRTTAQIEKEIADLEEKKRQHLADLRSSGKTTREYQEAQAAFIRGFRDYQQGQYIRALESFEIAETLYPKHPEAARYKFLSQRKLSELIQYKLDRGKKYRDRNNYKLCVAELKSVMVMIKDPNHTRYKEAKAMYNDCDLMMKGRY